MRRFKVYRIIDVAALRPLDARPEIQHHGGQFLVAIDLMDGYGSRLTVAAGEISHPALVFAFEVERHPVQLVIAGDGQRPVEARAADDAARQRPLERDGVHLGKIFVVDRVLRCLA